MWGGQPTVINSPCVGGTLEEIDLEVTHMDKDESHAHRDACVAISRCVLSLLQYARPF
jgi:hypothetical protein